MTRHIVCTRDGAVQILRIDRPEKKNALDAAMYEALADALEAANGDETIAATLVLGAPGAFSAGNDIGDFRRMAEEERGLGAGLLRFLRALVLSDRALVAGVDGLAIGIGTTMLLHCDHVVAGETAIFRTPFVDLGLVPEAASSLLAPRLMGHARAFSLLVLGEAMGAEAARNAGLVNRVVAPDAVEAEARAVARALAAKPREAMLAARRLLKGDPAEILARIEAEATLFAERIASQEAREAFAAFLNRGKA